MPILREGHGMAIPAGEGYDKDTLQGLYFFGHWHEWTGVHIKGHLAYVSKAKLAARAPAEAKDFSLGCKYHGMDISTACVDKLMLLKGCYAPWYGLVRITILISGEAACIRVS